MKNLIIEAKEQTPKIDFNAETGVLQMTGRAYTQKIIDFYTPVIKWVDDYVMEPQEKTVIELKMEYINSASTMIVANLLKKLSGLQKTGKQFIVNWYHQEEEE